MMAEMDCLGGGGGVDISDIVGVECFQYLRNISGESASALYVVGINHIQFKISGSGYSINIWEKDDKTSSIDTITNTTKTVDVSTYNVIYLSCSGKTVLPAYYTVID